jgi:hypothetical protein
MAHESLTLAREECNNYDAIGQSQWFAICSQTLIILSLSFSFMGGVAKKKKKKSK